ncbi:MAG: prolipoprotein diacylglyceryl transferase family protein [Moraxella osloensis]
MLDFIIPCVPTGLLFGRIGNFINGELWGRVSDGGYNSADAASPTSLYQTDCPSNGNLYRKATANLAD